MTDYTTPERHVFTIVGKGGRLSDLEESLTLATGTRLPKLRSSATLAAICSEVGDEVVFDFYSTLNTPPSEGRGLKTKSNLGEIGALAVLLLKCGYELMTPEYQEPETSSDDFGTTYRPLLRLPMEQLYAGTLVGENGSFDDLRKLVKFDREGDIFRVDGILCSPFPKEYLALSSEREVEFDLYVKKIPAGVLPTESNVFRLELGVLTTRMLMSGYKLSTRMTEDSVLERLPYHDF